MPYSLPGISELESIGRELGITLRSDETEQYRAVMDLMTPGFHLVEELAQQGSPRPRRVPYTRPERAENKYNAWRFRTSVKGAERGALRGKRIAVKDSIAVSGIPLTNGTDILESYVSDMDATIVTRVLDAGAEIVGTSVCEYFCFAGNSATSSTGPVENPRVPGHTSGGSSNGSAALLAAGEVDMALGADQAGSIRIPASYCGVVGMKPTFGLVPYTGAIGIEFSIDHLGPMARTVRDCALLLEVIAGDDGIDGRQRGAASQPYRAALDRGVEGLRVAVLQEAFGRPESESGVDIAVRATAHALARAGACVEEVSIPWHLHGPAIWLAIGIEGPCHNLLHGNGVGYGWSGAYSLSFMHAFEAWRPHASEVPPTIKAVLLLGEVLRRQRGRIYAKAQNLRRVLTSKYDAVLANYDVLLMPTTPMTASPIVTRDASVPAVLGESWKMMNNTCPFDVTGHPAISVPCGELDGKPVGCMLVSQHLAESTLLRVANAVNQWNPAVSPPMALA